MSQWTNEDLTRLYAQVKHCKKILEPLGVVPSNEINYTFANFRQYGRYSKIYGERTIAINHTFFRYAINHDIEQLNNTLIHEMLHDVANDGDAHCGHRGLWKHLSFMVSMNTNYKITTKIDKEFERIYLAYLCNTNQNNTNSSKAYYVICQDCGKVLTIRQKKTKVIDSIIRSGGRYSCGLCKSPNLTVEYK